MNLNFLKMALTIIEEYFYLLKPSRHMLINTKQLKVVTLVAEHIEPRTKDVWVGYYYADFSKTIAMMYK